MRATLHERRGHLRARGAERHAVPGKPTTHEEPSAGVSDIGERVVREAHRAGPAVRHRRADAVLAQESVEVSLDLRGRRLVLADLSLQGGVAPPADDDA